jgi:prepilin-type N-terminal cleavage/methylation domain-containing protein
MVSACLQAGFTLLELVVVLIITLVLATTVLPSYSAWTAELLIDGKIADLHAALRLARAEAVGMQHDIKFCPVNPDMKCQKSSDYRVLIFADVNANNLLDYGDVPLRQIDLQELRVELRVSAGRPYIRYKYSGDSKEWGSVNLYNRLVDPEASRQLVVNLGGRVRTAPDFNNDGLADDYRGWQVTCS